MVYKFILGPGTQHFFGTSLYLNNFDIMFTVGDDMEGLLFHFLDEWLFIFSADDFFIPRNETLYWYWYYFMVLV